MIKTGEWESTDSTLDLLGGMTRMLQQGKFKFLPYNGKMVSTNAYGNRLGQEAVDAFNAKLNKMIELNPDIDFGDIPGAQITSEANVISVPELEFIKVSPAEIKKKGGKLKLIKNGNKF